VILLELPSRSVPGSRVKRVTRRAVPPARCRWALRVERPRLVAPRYLLFRCAGTTGDDGRATFDERYLFFPTRKAGTRQYPSTRSASCSRRERFPAAIRARDELQALVRLRDEPTVVTLRISHFG
jgi:hypothetical protein